MNHFRMAFRGIDPQELSALLNTVAHSGTDKTIATSETTWEIRKGAGGLLVFAIERFEEEFEVSVEESTFLPIFLEIAEEEGLEDMDENTPLVVLVGKSVSDLIKFLVERDNPLAEKEILFSIRPIEKLPPTLH